MRTRYNELSVGITVTIATLLVVFGILLLGKSTVLIHGMLVNMTVENAEGLGTGDEVHFRGIAAGTVQSVNLEPRGVLAVLKFHGNPEIPVDSKFIIHDSSLLGGKVVEIKAGKSKSYLESGATVTGQAQTGLLGVAESSSDLTRKINDILGNVDTLSGPQTAKSLDGILTSLQTLTRSLHTLVQANNDAVSSTLANLQAVSSSANSTMNNLDEISSQNKKPVNDLIVSMNKTNQELQQVIERTGATVEELNTMLSAMRAGQGSLGKLLVDDSLYVQMKSTLAEFDSLVKDIKANPKKYVTVKIF